MGKNSLANRKKPTNIKDRLRKKLALKKGDKKICLNMIVRNESRNMVRLLDSLKSIIDMVSIVDTGSTDNTPQVINEWGAANNIPTTVHFEPFKNFGYNRTHSIEKAQETYPEADYFLLSDADFVWNIEPTFNKALLYEHKYLVKQVNKVMSYWNVRMLAANIKWKCVGVTHEYWREDKDQTKYTGEIRHHQIESLWIDDREDGGCKSDKFERDERLLKAELEEPDLPEDLRGRYYFYLAQTLRDLHRHQESIDYYQRRIDHGGWDEEIYYSRYQIGRNYCFLADKEKRQADLLVQENPQPSEEVQQQITEHRTKQQQYLIKSAETHEQAYRYRPTRAEALSEACRIYSDLRQYEKVYELARIGIKLKPPHDMLFVEQHPYQDYLYQWYLSLACYYLGKKQEGQKYVETLLLRDDIPDYIRRGTEQNAKFYL